MKQYRQLVEHILANGHDREDRTGTGTRSVFGYQMRFDLQEGFPLVTLKHTAFRLVLSELLWFLRGSTDNNELLAERNYIWREWATEEGGQLGPIYGYQWRKWEGWDGTCIDQIAELVKGLKERPYSRRHIVSAWNVTDLPDETMSPQENVEEGRMALAPCHTMFQFYVRDMTLAERLQYEVRHKIGGDFSVEACKARGLWQDHSSDEDDERIANEYLDELGVPRRSLSCQLYQRSGDVFLGVPFNIASYALLTHMLARVLGYAAGEYVHTLGDAHLYLNHMTQVKEMLSRDERALPQLVLGEGVESIFDFTKENVKLVGYDPHPAIKAKVAV